MSRMTGPSCASRTPDHLVGIPTVPDFGASVSSRQRHERHAENGNNSAASRQPGQVERVRNHEEMGSGTSHHQGRALERCHQPRRRGPTGAALRAAGMPSEASAAERCCLEPPISILANTARPGRWRLRDDPPTSASRPSLARVTSVDVAASWPVEFCF
jgi:hypothetical protein